MSEFSCNIMFGASSGAGTHQEGGNSGQGQPKCVFDSAGCVLSKARWRLNWMIGTTVLRWVKEADGGHINFSVKGGMEIGRAIMMQEFFNFHLP
jgi:hypothetical protein